MKLWREIMFSCCVPFRTTRAEWDEYDVGHTPPTTHTLARRPQSTHQARPPDL